MKTGYWIIRSYEAGPVGEKTKYWVPGEKPERRSKQKEREAIRKAEQNEYSCLKRAARILNANFTAGDLLIGLDYSDEGLAALEREIGPADPEQDAVERMNELRAAAEHQLKLYLRRVKRALRERGEALRVFAVTSDMDGDTGETVRIHHHLIVPACALELMREKWTLGGVYEETLRRQKDYTPLAEYLLRQVRRVPDAKKYVTSRNLIRPEPKDRVALSEAELRVPKGGQLLYRGAHTWRGPQYIRYVLPGKWKDEERDAGAAPISQEGREADDPPVSRKRLTAPFIQKGPRTEGKQKSRNDEQPTRERRCVGISRRG